MFFYDPTQRPLQSQSDEYRPSIHFFFFFCLYTDAVGGVSVQVPLVAMESKNVSLKCVWTAGTETLVQWKKGGAAVLPDSRITITDEGDLVINPGQRADTGDYICTVSNLVSAQSATKTLTVYCKSSRIRSSLAPCYVNCDENKLRSEERTKN